MSVPLRLRLTAWYVALLALILAALSTFLIIRLKGDLIAGIDDSLDSRAAQIALGYRGGGEGEFSDVADATLSGVPRGESAAQILSASGQVLESSGPPGDVIAQSPLIDAATLARVVSGHTIRKTAGLGPDQEPFRVLALPAPKHPASQALVVITSLEDVDMSVHRLLVLLLVGGPAALLLAGVGGWWLAHRALVPVARITEEAAGIEVDQLGKRVAVPRSGDELERLARTLNSMLERLEAGVEDKRRFLADASHELRTPLAIMRSELDVSLRSERLSPDSRAVLESAVEEVERMTRILENLLTLARIDEGRLELMVSPVDLGSLVSDVVDGLRPIADAKGIAIQEAYEEVLTQADRERLKQAVGNLVENAVKYTAPGGEVLISVRLDEGAAGVTVSDTGPGIAQEALPRIFDRFYRADTARSRAAGGSGLGLAICREIVEAHGGSVWAESELGTGTSFSLRLPLHDSERRATTTASSQR